MGTKDYLLQQTAFQKRVSTSGPVLPLLDKVYSMQGIFDQLSNHQFLKKASAP
jgi:hypothetical protein